MGVRFYKGNCTGNHSYKGCGAEDVVLVNTTKKLCLKCNQKRLSVGKELVKKPAAKKKKTTGELKMFKEIAEERAWICEVCNNKINYVKVHNFAHVLSKKSWPKFRLYKKNIVIMCFEFDGTGCHTQYDQGNKNLPKFAWVNKLAEDLRIEYLINNLEG